MNKGKFIVIEGTDGSGKTTQFEKLVLRIEKPVALFDFPQHGKPSAYFVDKYLNGGYGTLDQIGPKTGSVFYAVDRYDVGFQIRKALEEGKICVANRYVGSNMGHQGAKFHNKEERLEYFKWLYDLEYGIMGIPKPDLNIILHMPAEMSQKMVDKKNEGMRQYIGKKRDLHEANLDHLKHAEMVYLEMAEIFPNDFKLVECVENDKLLSIDEIHEKVWKLAKKLLNA